MKKLIGFFTWLLAFVPIATFLYVALYDEGIYDKPYWYYIKDGYKNLVTNK